ncbi:3-ketoacyl-CoA thiolase A peroxisomal [Ceratocystis platani]|uniref:3-ketoacyl-CoA thiolase A peroxisomal n=1 Tax=Ceratocystis fimbriata f. sp. platani TaxID=88771 RepID=A0A0F8B4Q2_CERFI|nr:3-ketoacyl-CoA thiolase A peroxisomal [Ceratocystis platani]
MALRALTAKAPTDVVVLSALRTPITRAGRGPLKDAYPEELLAAVLARTVSSHPNLPPSAIADVAVGTVLSELGGSKAARAALNSIRGISPHATSLYTVNRACASSLQSIAAIAGAIQTGTIDTGIAAGMESMSRNYGSRAIPTAYWPALADAAVAGKDATDCFMPMGLTSENVAARYGIDRASQDALALESHRRAAAAQAAGHFTREIVPVTTRFTPLPPKNGTASEADLAERTVTANADDGVRPQTTRESLAKLKPAFTADGTSTAGNSSQVSDGAAALLLMRRSTATELGLSSAIMGKFGGAVCVGCAPSEMGLGPVHAVPALLNRLGLRTTDVDRWEINEAFASQAVYSIQALGLEDAYAQGKVNPDGGAIALGHPLGATGARLAVTALHGLERTGGHVSVVSMCVGTGMGMAGVFVRE